MTYTRQIVENNVTNIKPWTKSSSDNKYWKTLSDIYRSKHLN